MLTALGLTSGTAAVIAGLVLLVSVWLAARRQVKPTHVIAAVFVGLAVAGGWFGTYFVAQSSFEIVPVTSVTFTGPSTDTLMGLVNERNIPYGFGIGLVPGVFIGAGGMALLTRQWHIERFGPDTPMERYLVGAALIGFGSMLAGGCAVGAGMSGGAIFAVTAWMAVFCMWLGAMATHALLQRGALASAA